MIRLYFALYLCGLGRVFKRVDVQVAGIVVALWRFRGESIVGRQISEGGTGLRVAGRICVVAFHAVDIPLVNGFKLYVAAHQITLR